MFSNLNEKSPEQEQKEKKKEEAQTQHSEDENDSHQDTNQFKAHRRFLFMLGKTIKYMIWGSFALFMYHLYLVQNKPKPEEYFGVTDAFLNAARSTKYAYEDLYALLTRPPVNSLLMERPPLPPGYQNMKTLVLNITGLLVHSEYKLGIGFEILKRPGLSVFMNRMSKNYEVVLFADTDQGFVHEIADALDPQGAFIAGRLGRESTIVKNGVYCKDFSYLGRPVRDVVYLDFTDETVPYHKENTIILPQWTGNSEDRALFDIIPFLESLAQKPTDVRDELKRYGRENTAQSFNSLQTQRRDMILRQREKGVTGMMTGVNKLNQENRPMPKLEVRDFGSSFGRS